MSKHSETAAGQLDVWGDSLLNKLPARSRKQRKRAASKQRRIIERKQLNMQRGS